jgi:hypothetical protein
MIRDALGFGVVEVESTGNLESNITIRVGQDALQQGAILKETAQPNVAPVKGAESSTIR